MALRTREISQAWAQAWVPSAQGVDVSPNSHWLPGHLPFHQDEDPLGWPQVWGPRRANTGFIPLPHCQGTFNFKGSNMLFSSFVCSFFRTLYSLSVPGKQEWAELHALLRTEIMREGTCLDSFQWLPSVTPFSDLFSYSPLMQDIECFLALWRLLFAWLCFCSVFLLPKVASYEDIETRISANKAPLFHLRFGCPASVFSSTPVPRSGLQRPWQYTNFYS